MTDTADNAIDFREVAAQQANQLELLQERLAELELALEDVGWTRLAMEAEGEFSKGGLDKIAQLARVMALKNPLIKRAVKVKADYVFGQGMTVQAPHAEINAVVRAFLDDEKNLAELSSHQARLQKERERQTDGNIFLVLFPNAATGRVRVRSIPMGEIVDVLADPEDAKSPWFYKRVWQTTTIDAASGRVSRKRQTAYYPDWRYTPINRPASIGGKPVMWDTPIYHIKASAYSDWKFGISEVYAALDWARAYKEFLEDVATIMRALSRFAAKVTTKGGKQGIAAAKTRLGTTLGSGSGSSAETNPPPTTGSVFIAGEGSDYTPLNVRGASVAPEDGRRFLLMVAAATDLPETFFGDADVGNHATAKTLDRPTELAMRDVQTLWASVYGDLFAYVLRWAVKAPRGALSALGRVEVARDGDEIVEQIVWATDPATQRPIAPTVNISFPPILALDVEGRINAIIAAATLGGKPLAGTIDLRTVSRMVLTALGEEKIDELLAALFPEGQQPDSPIAQEAAAAVRAALAEVMAKYQEP